MTDVSNGRKIPYFIRDLLLVATLVAAADEEPDEKQEEQQKQQSAYHRARYHTCFIGSWKKQRGA